jgi:hypothetical protein
MYVLDLVTPHLEHLAAGGTTAQFVEQHPVPYEHYRRFWWEPVPATGGLDADHLRQTVLRIGAALPEVEARLSRIGLETGEHELLLFVGGGGPNGHALRTPRGFAAWIAVEVPWSERGLAAFLPHEIAHATHYARSPDFHFEDEVQLRHVGRTLICEGLATRAAMLASKLDAGEALWGDVLVGEERADWLRACEARDGELRRRLLADFDTSPQASPFFYLDPTADVPERAGYYVGLSVVRELERELGLRVDQLMDLERPVLEQRVRGALAAGA